MLIWKLVQQLDTIVLFIYKQIMQLYYLTRKTHPINTYSPSSHSKILCSFSTCHWWMLWGHWMGGIQEGHPDGHSSVEGSEHFGSFVRNISLHLCKRLFPRLEPVTSCHKATALPLCQWITECTKKNTYHPPEEKHRYLKFLSYFLKKISCLSTI